MRDLRIFSELCLPTDSEIAKNLMCGKDKIASLAKFSFAPHVKKLLVANVNSGSFTLMFDD